MSSAIAINCHLHLPFANVQWKLSNGSLSISPLEDGASDSELYNNKNSQSTRSDTENIDRNRH